jgi:hypothetical protein
MAFKLTYSDGQESDHDDDTVWELDNGVLKLGREEGTWSVLLSPSHWAVLELGAKKSKDGDDKDDDEDKDAKDKKDEKSKDDDDDDDDKKDD